MRTLQKYTLPYSGDEMFVEERRLLQKTQSR